eukprot:gb/GECG01004506.1/.p1 GENE.gb/GECG01004506.1/~~gb/GECG01004506.1/.p1  ORF type:complete len:110 (+),score=3.35 gb/GECG01004506.1/:1-330(+)
MVISLSPAMRIINTSILGSLWYPNWFLSSSNEALKCADRQYLYRFPLIRKWILVQELFIRLQFLHSDLSPLLTKQFFLEYLLYIFQIRFLPALDPIPGTTSGSPDIVQG